MVHKIELLTTPPYNFEGSFSFLSPICPDPIAYFDGKTFERIWQLNGNRFCIISIQSIGSVDKPRLKITLDGKDIRNEDIEFCRRRIEEVLCLHLDLNVFYETVRTDPTLHQHCLRNLGLKPVLEPDLFEVLTWAIIGQQVNLRFACQVKGGMLEKFAERVVRNGKTFFRYPQPSELAGKNPVIWREFKCSGRKAEYIIGLAERILDGFNLDDLKNLSDDEIIQRLMDIRGIGRWTAEYVLIQGFGRWDALPTGDAGLQNGIKEVYKMDRKPTEAEIVQLAESWRPYRGLATYYLWWGKQFKPEAG